MAANPVRRKLLADIEASGGWEAVFERVASGGSQTAIAASFGVTQGFLSRVIHQDVERVRGFREAKRLWAITLVERTGDLVNNVKENRDSIAKVREVAAHARWEAGKWDRELFGEDKGDVNVTMNFAQLMPQ
jgi:ssDNA-binding replication factor A large subunit